MAKSTNGNTKSSFDTFMDEIKASASELLEQLDAREAFLAFVEENRPQLQQFVAAGDQAQVGVMAFRFRTWARDHALMSVRATEQKVWAIVFTALRMGLALGVAA